MAAPFDPQRPAFVNVWLSDLQREIDNGVRGEALIVYREAIEALVYEHELSDSVARMFAAWYHDGSTVALAFTSTGTVPESSETLMRVLFPHGEDDCESAADRAVYNLLGTYVVGKVLGRDA